MLRHLEKTGTCRPRLLQGLGGSPVSGTNGPQDMEIEDALGRADEIECADMAP